MSVCLYTIQKKQPVKNDMKSRKFISILICLLMLVMTMSGCGKGAKSDGPLVNVYYLSRDGYSVVPVQYELTATDTHSQIEELLVRLSLESTFNDYKRTIPTNVEVNGYDVTSGCVTLFFDADYSSIPATTEIMIRSAIVRTMLQIEGVDSVSFVVGGSTLFDAGGNIVGVMSANSFLIGLGDDGDAIETTSVTLYFSSLDGQSLLSETRDIAFSDSSATPLTKLVVDQLIIGPTNPDAQGIFAPTTRVISATVTDGICYVNFDEGFLNQAYSVSEPVAIYSIVNSLTNIDGVQKVQFYVNGSSVGMYRGIIDLSSPLERSDDAMIPIIIEDENSHG